MSAVLAQRIEPSIFDAMVLIEPILQKNDAAKSTQIIQASLKRKAVFESREKAAESFIRLAMYQRFTPEAFWLYVVSATSLDPLPRYAYLQKNLAVE